MHPRQNLRRLEPRSRQLGPFVILEPLPDAEGMVQRVLLVDAGEDLQPLARELEASGFLVEVCPAEELSARLARAEMPDLLLLNLTRVSLAQGHPAFGGVRPSERPPTLALLGEDQVVDLDPTLGIDDFAVHPVAPSELLARLRQVLWRRAGVDARNVLRCGDLLIDLASYKVFVAGHPVDLTYKEYELLRFLASHRNKVFTREALLNRVWGYDFSGGARTVDVHVRRLRSKLEDSRHAFIETVRNVGYRFHADA